MPIAGGAADSRAAAVETAAGCDVCRRAKRPPTGDVKAENKEGREGVRMEEEEACAEDDCENEEGAMAAATAEEMACPMLPLPLPLPLPSGGLGCEEAAEEDSEPIDPPDWPLL